MKRWDSNVNDWTEVPDVEAFLMEIIEVCRRHNMTFSQEDTGNALGVRRGFDSGEDGAGWIVQASVSKDSVKSDTTAWTLGLFEVVGVEHPDGGGRPVMRLVPSPPDPGLAPPQPVEDNPCMGRILNQSCRWDSGPCRCGFVPS